MSLPYNMSDDTGYKLIDQVGQTPASAASPDVAKTSAVNVGLLPSEEAAMSLSESEQLVSANKTISVATVTSVGQEISLLLLW